MLGIDAIDYDEYWRFYEEKMLDGKAEENLKYFIKLLKIYKKSQSLDELLEKYNQRKKISQKITNKSKEKQQTKNAYTDLFKEITATHKNILDDFVIPCANKVINNGFREDLNGFNLPSEPIDLNNPTKWPNDKIHNLYEFLIIRFLDRCNPSKITEEDNKELYPLIDKWIGTELNYNTPWKSDKCSIDNNYCFAIYLGYEVWIFIAYIAYQKLELSYQKNIIARKDSFNLAQGLISYFNTRRNNNKQDIKSECEDIHDKIVNNEIEDPNNKQIVCFCTVAIHEVLTILEDNDMAWFACAAKQCFLTMLKPEPASGVEFSSGKNRNGLPELIKNIEGNLISDTNNVIYERLARAIAKLKKYSNAELASYQGGTDPNRHYYQYGKAYYEKFYEALTKYLSKHNDMNQKGRENVKNGLQSYLTMSLRTPTSNKMDSRFPFFMIKNLNKSCVRYKVEIIYEISRIIDCKPKQLSQNLNK